MTEHDDHPLAEIHSGAWLMAQHFECELCGDTGFVPPFMDPCPIEHDETP